MTRPRLQRESPAAHNARMADRCDEAAAALTAHMKTIRNDPDLRDSLERQSRQNTEEANAYRAKALDLSSSSTPASE